MAQLLVNIGVSFAQLALIALLYAGLRRAYRLLALNEEAYHRPLLLLELAKRPKALLVTIGPFLLALGNPSVSWASMAGAEWLRPFVCALTAWMALAGATYAFNWYLGRWHLFDRALLILLAIASAFHPSFAVLVAAWAVTLTGQFIHPVFAGDRSELYAYTHRMALVHQLLLFHAYLCASSIVHLPPARFIALALVVQGAHYFHSALGKLRLRWLQRNQLDGLICAAVAHGWWPRPHGSAPQRLGRWIRWANGPLLFTCLALELGGGFLLVHADVAIVLLIALAALHVVILLVSGINFLPWAFLDLCLAVAISSQPEGTFGLLPLLTTAPFTAAAPMLFGVYVLAWLDAKLCNAYRFEAIATNGQVYELSPDAFAPYDMILANGKFRFLSDERLLVDAWSESSDASVVQAISHTSTLREINDLEQQFGTNYFGQRATERMGHFMRAFLRSRGERRCVRAGCWLARDWLATGAHTAALRTLDLRALSIRIVKLLYVGNEIRLIEDRLLHEIELSKA